MRRVFQVDVSGNRTSTRPRAKVKLPVYPVSWLFTIERIDRREQLNLSESSPRILASRVLGNLESLVLNGESSEADPIERIDPTKNSRCGSRVQTLSRRAGGWWKCRRNENGPRRMMEKRETRSWRKARKEARSFPLSCSARRHVRAWLAGARKFSVCVAACTYWSMCVCVCVCIRDRAFYIRVASRRGKRVHARVRPRRTCTLARTHAWPRSRVCLCGDPNEGRQASKLGRAAAARAAILLESGWKTSPRPTRSSVTRLERGPWFSSAVDRSPRDSCHTLQLCVAAENRRACARVRTVLLRRSYHPGSSTDRST